MNRKILIAGILIILTAVVSFSSQKTIEAIVAIVNNEIITLSDFKEQHDNLYTMLRSQFEGEEFTRRYNQLSKQLLDTMITEALLLQEAKKMGVDVSEQIKMTIENIKEENNIQTDEQLRQLMAQQGMSFEEWRKAMEESYMKQSIIMTNITREIAVDDSEIVNYYKNHQDEFIEPEEYSLKAIFIQKEGKNAEEIESLKQEITAKIAKGENFEQLASRYSDGPLRNNQGDLGSFKKGELAENLEKAVSLIEPGEVTSWLEVEKGWYLLKLEEKKESRLKSFEEVRREIEEKLFEEKREKKSKEFIERLKKESYIKILIENPLEYIH